PLWLVGFDLEEYGLAGSAALAADLHRQRQPLRLMISLEMLGYRSQEPYSQQYPPGLNYFYPSQGDFIALIGSWQLIPQLVGLRRSLRTSGVPCEWLPVVNGGKAVPDTRRSDHAPFWDRGYRAVLVTDTANLRNPHYHQPSDRVSTLDFSFLTGVCMGLMQGISQL
ncbi:peptidase M28, partial [filamentous cyanobacterium CCP5]